jgi:hypothetical protein
MLAEERAPSMSLEFPDTSPFYDSERRGVRFFGKHGRRTVSCLVSDHAILDSLKLGNADEQGLVNGYKKLANRIHAAAAAKFAAGLIESNGMVIVRSVDLAT